METGHDFLRAQVNNCIVQHHALLDAVRMHAEQADDQEYRDLCIKYLPHLQQHQTMLEAYGNTIGTVSGSAVKNALGAVLSKARDVVDAFRETDFLRVVGDIVMIRQSQDTFATFATAGEHLGDTKLAEVGRMGEAQHDDMQREFNAYVTTLFVAHVQENVPEKSSRATETKHDSHDAPSMHG